MRAALFNYNYKYKYKIKDQEQVQEDPAVFGHQKGSDMKNKYITHVAPFMKEIGQMARNGATEAEIAAKLNVALSTFKKYKTEHPELKEQLLATKELADLDVEAALYSRAIGIEVKETTEIIDPKGRVTKKTVTKELPPDTSAALFFLKNRKPELWKDRQSVESDIRQVVIVDDF